MNATEFESYKVALFHLLERRDPIAPVQSAIEVRQVSTEIGVQYTFATADNPAKFASTATELAMGGDCSCYEVYYVWYDCNGKQTETCAGALIFHQNGGRTYAIV